MKQRMMMGALIMAQAVAVAAVEVQISLGAESAFGLFIADTQYGYMLNSIPSLVDEHRLSLYSAPGLGCVLRIFGDSGPVSLGVVIRDRVLIIAAANRSGWVTMNEGTRSSFDETVYLSSDEWVVSIFEWEAGSSARLVLSDWWQMYGEFGLHGTLLEIDSTGGDTSASPETTRTYLGMGVFGSLGFQLCVSTSWYLELGFTTIINVLSTQRGTARVAPTASTSYEDTGLGDLMSVTPYLHVGWRITTGGTDS